MNIPKPWDSEKHWEACDTFAAMEKEIEEWRERSLTISSAEVLLLEGAVRVITRNFNDFIAACVDDAGKPKMPSHRDIAKARGYMPAGYSMSYGEKKS